MGKNTLSYVLLICAAVVAYLYITDYIDRVSEENFTTPSVVEVNKTVEEMRDGSFDYSVGVRSLENEIDALENELP